jgi:hypothetical protein
MRTGLLLTVLLIVRDQITPQLETRIRFLSAEKAPSSLPYRNHVVAMMPPTSTTSTVPTITGSQRSTRGTG